ncbi:ABC transporter permease subunit [Actinospica robiniae]|uniref:ABC transporter permease subunit n=1 Tax=Actinospica robiniae TaxID=304901 RepID=UPI000421C74E|nr:ABC transporter permease subunit [Actinospica robiniae]
MTSLDVVPPAPQSSYRSTLPQSRAGFRQLVHAEWTKFRTVRGWALGVLGAIALMTLMSVTGAHTGSNCVNGICSAGPSLPHYAPTGIPVSDSFYFVHQNLDGDGSITVRVESLTDTLEAEGPHESAPDAGSHETWGKAGILIKAGSTPGSSYAAVMATSGHGIRMQWDYTHDVAGRPAAANESDPGWLRLTRAGDTITGYESADAKSWTKLSTVTLPGLSPGIQAGMFATSPEFSQDTQLIGGLESSAYASTASATLDQVSLQGGWSSGAWTGTAMGDGNGSYTAQPGADGDTSYFLTGNGDIAAAADLDDTAAHSEAGAFLALIILTVLATQFVTAEFKHRLLGATLAASPSRGRVLAAKTLVVASVAGVVGLVASAVSVPLFNRVWPAGALYKVGAGTEVRVILGTALLLAVAAVFALAIGTIFRRSAVVITTVLVVMVLPYILAIGSLLPGGAADWLLRVTPAAAFAIQQTIPVYPQVDNIYLPYAGYYPLAPWAGFAVLCGYAAVAMGAAWLVLRRRDVTA